MIGLEEVLPDVELAEVGGHISFTEQRAAEAEKELRTVLILQLLSKRIGEEMDCVVSGLTNFGIFVQCVKFGVEGLVALEDLGVDEWRYNERSQAVVGLHSGKSVHLGQEMHVRIASVNIAGRQLSVVPVELLVSSRAQVHKGKKHKKGRHLSHRSGRRRAWR